MKLSKIIKDLKYIDVKNFNDITISVLCDNSKQINSNSLFFCIVGTKIDGHLFAEQAVKNGAVALVVEKFLNVDVPQIKVEDTRKAMSKCASNFYHHVDKKLNIIGVTGTNGKTTITYILKHIFDSLGEKTALFGTSKYIIDKIEKQSALTTPDTLQLFNLLNEAYNAGVKYVFMEISAHAIALNKIYGIKFKTGVFTNLSQDHLDFFDNMSTYGAIKKRFMLNNCKSIVVNIDDKFAQSIYNEFKGDKISTSINLPADYIAINVTNSHKGSIFSVKHLCYTQNVEISLSGNYNVSNCLQAIAVACECGFDLHKVIQTLKTFDHIIGRSHVQKVRDFYVVIDYAHTPDGLENIMSSILSWCKGRLISVFGCPGNRDSLKRPVMGEIASKYSSKIFLTSDNPRYENVNDIINSILRGSDAKKCICEPQREKAILMALYEAKKDDVVLIAGKGHETYQDIKAIKVPYSDYNVVQKYIDNLD